MHYGSARRGGVHTRTAIGLLAVVALLLAACAPAAPAPTAAPNTGAAAAKPTALPPPDTSQKAATQAEKAIKPEAKADTKAAQPAAKAGSESGVDANGVVVRMQGESLDAYIARLYEAAKKEGQINYYHSANKEELDAIVSNWNKLFPEVKFVETQATSGTILERALTECRANRVQADVYGGSAGDQAALDQQGCITEYRPLNEQFIDPAYVFAGEPYIGIGYLSFHLTYNTNLISDAEVPSDWESFLDPKWQGKLSIDQSAFEWFGALVSHMGQEKGLDYMRKLAQQDVRLVDGSTLRTELLAAGEFPVALDLYGHRISQFVERGEPIAAKLPHPVPMPAVVDMSSIMKAAPHPNAARLAQEFFLMPEGQEVFLMQNKAGVRIEGVTHPYGDLIEGVTFKVLGPKTIDFNQANKQFSDIFLRR